MKTTTAFAFLSLAFCCISSASADTFGSGDNVFDIDFVTIGNPGNDPDMTGNPAPPYPTGSVDYTYRIGQFEISEDMIDKANTLGDLGLTHDNRGANKPATSISWFDVAKFVNWLNGSTPAYKFDGSGNFQVWEPGDAGFDANNLYRNSQAKYFLPSVDEWYKAAYYDPTGVYYNYPTGSDSIPDGIDSAGDTTFDAVFFDSCCNPQPNDITDVGVLSPYGTAGQGGNVYEWEETDFDLVNDSTSSARGIRGGFWVSQSFDLLSSARNDDGSPSLVSNIVGFRVASIIPEPSADFDNDGDVDGADFLSWQRNDGSQSNLTIWQEQFGTITSAAITIIPEPTSIVLAVSAVLVGVGVGRRRKCAA
jgi:sulfatase modifying factor 1